MTRTRTSPEVKWVANELAAVRGELARIADSMARLAQLRSKLQEDLAALEHVAEQLGVVPPMARDLSVRACQRRLNSDPPRRSKSDPPRPVFDLGAGPVSGGLPPLGGDLAGAQLVA